MIEKHDKSIPTTEQHLEILRKMLLIRRMEERLKVDFDAGNLPGGVHLYIGQEAIATGVCAHLNDNDWIASTHRGHGHFLAKGGEPGPMLAEIYGYSNGICGGMGGSMHVADFSRGIIGANGIVAGGMAITVGAAFAAKLDGNSQIAVCFFGDGASNQGVFMEALNVSTLWELPLIMVCEHNTYSEFSPSHTVTAGEIVDRARAFGMPTSVVDGNDVLAVWEATSTAVERARNDQGPSFIEANTYRIYGHNESEIHWLSSEYRDDEEIEPWRKKDPIDRFNNYLLENDVCSQKDMDDIEAQITETVEEAVQFAQSGTPPNPEVVQDLMFVNQDP